MEQQLFGPGRKHSGILSSHRQVAEVGSLVLITCGDSKEQVTSALMGVGELFGERSDLVNSSVPCGIMRMLLSQPLTTGG